MTVLTDELLASFDESVSPVDEARPPAASAVHIA